MGKVLEVCGLTKRFGDFTAVDGVSFSVNRGEVFGFLGSNGSGKTTTVRMLCGILTPTGGEGNVLGYDIYSQTENIRQSIGYMSQRFSLYEELTVVENMDFYAGIYSVSAGEADARKKELIALVGLEGKDKQFAGTMSGGQKQRLALACALIHQPPLLFLDEPTAGVDPLSRRNFWKILHQLAAQGVTIFVTTHYMDEADQCHRLGFMHQGRLIGLVLQNITVLLTAFALVRERERGTMEQLIVTPIKPRELIIGKLIPYVVIAFIDVIIVLSIGVYWFNVPVKGSMLSLMLHSLVFLLVALGLGMLISTVAKTQLQAMQMTLLLILPSVILSGFIFPREAMPLPIQLLGNLIPLTYFLEILRGVILKGVGLEYLWKEVAILFVIGVATLSVASLRFKKNLD